MFNANAGTLYPGGWTIHHEMTACPRRRTFEIDAERNPSNWITETKQPRGRWKIRPSCKQLQCMHCRKAVLRVKLTLFLFAGGHVPDLRPCLMPPLQGSLSGLCTLAFRSSTRKPAVARPRCGCHCLGNRAHLHSKRNCQELNESCRPVAPPAATVQKQRSYGSHSKSLPLRRGVARILGLSCGRSESTSSAHHQQVGFVATQQYFLI